MNAIPSRDPVKPGASRFLFPLGVLLTLPLAAPAQNAPPPVPMAGTQISLTTSTARALPGPDSRGGRVSFVAATVKLSNRGFHPIHYSFPDLESARSKFTFALYGQSDTLVWSGRGLAPARTPVASSTGQILRPRTSWTATARVPLLIGGACLAPGAYRIEAALAGEPAVFAAASFEILPTLAVATNPWPRPPATNEPRVYSVDELVVERIALPGGGGEGLRITASGWVNSGGWSHPRLVERPIPMIYPPPSLPFDFVATPPPPGVAVTMALVRVTASVTVLVVPGAPSVTVHAASNAITKPIIAF